MMRRYTMQVRGRFHKSPHNLKRSSGTNPVLGSIKTVEYTPVECVLTACWPYPVVSHVSRGGGGVLHPGELYIQGGLPLRGFASRGGLHPWGGLHPGGVCIQGVGVGQIPPPVCLQRGLGRHPRGQTNTCENITLPQISFAVMNTGTCIWNCLNPYTLVICMTSTWRDFGKGGQWLPLL